MKLSLKKYIGKQALCLDSSPQLSKKQVLVCIKQVWWVENMA